MILNGTIAPKRFVRDFKCPTRISVQVIGAATVTLARDQGEAASANDGIQLTQGSTAPPNQPYETLWQGELWYRASADNAQFVILVLGESK